MFSPVPPGSYRFGPFRLDPASRVLDRDGTVMPLAPRTFDLLHFFVKSGGRLLTKHELLNQIWGDVNVQEASLAFQVSTLRKVLGEDGNAWIETVPKHGYRFTAPVHDVPPEDTRNPEAGSMPPAARVRLVPAMWRWAAGLVAVVAALVAVRYAARPDDPVRVTIAILPFEHLGGPEREYLTDGLTEELSASLGQIDPEHLSVQGRSSTRRYKGTSQSPRVIGGALGVEYLVEGSVRTESRRLRVTPRLIRVRDQEQIWAESYESEPGSMLELQRELSAAIARQVRLRLSPDRLTALAARHSRNADAYDLYLRGRQAWNQLTPAANRSAVGFYEKATQLDPEFALPWAGLADAYSTSPITSDVLPWAAATKARPAAAHAFASGADLAETLTALGTVSYWLDWDWPASETAFRKAIAVDPSYSQAHRALGLVLVAMDRHEEAREAMRRARELDPNYPMQSVVSAYERWMARDYPPALVFAQQATAVDPSFWIGYYMLAAVYEQLGNSELALKALEESEALSANSKNLSLRGYILAKSGRTSEAEAVLRRLQGIARERYVPPYAMALVYAGLGQSDPVFDWLDRAYLVRDVHLVRLDDPKWNAFREDPRFRALVERCDFMRTAKTGGHTER